MQASIAINTHPGRLKTSDLRNIDLIDVILGEKLGIKRWARSKIKLIDANVLLQIPFVIFWEDNYFVSPNEDL